MYIYSENNRQEQNKGKTHLPFIKQITYICKRDDIGIWIDKLKDNEKR